jgi:hypothetical protein
MICESCVNRDKVIKDLIKDLTKAREKLRFLDKKESLPKEVNALHQKIFGLSELVRDLKRALDSKNDKIMVDRRKKILSTPKNAEILAKLMAHQRDSDSMP